VGITIDWGNEAQTVLVATIDWPFTWFELFEGWDNVVALIRAKPYTVHLIVVGKTAGFPDGDVLTHLKYTSTRIPDNLGLAIMVAPSRFSEVINTILFSLTPRLNKTGHVVRTLDDAYALIHQENTNSTPPADTHP
jgi:hypothetical protein